MKVIADLRQKNLQNLIDKEKLDDIDEADF